MPFNQENLIPMKTISAPILADDVKCERLDKYGALASAICAVHCLLTSIAFGLLSVSGLGFLGNELIDIIFVVLAVSVGSFAVRNGYKHHRSYVPATLFFTGLMMVIISHFFLGHSHLHNALPLDHHHHDLSPLQETISSILAVLGGLTLVMFHVINAKLQKKARKLSCCKNCH